MPELPEVETIRSQLSASIVGETIELIEVRRAKSWRGNPEEVVGRRVKAVTRVGKYLFFHTDREVGLVGHLKMTGRMIVKNYEEYETKLHTRVVVRFASGRKLYFWDTRVFGYLEVTNDSKKAEARQKKKLGDDPWEITKGEFFVLCQKYKRPIKSVILDQALLSGVGNIYANDALWLAKILPTRPASSLTKAESSRILMSLRQVMARGLATGGASDNSYVNAYNEKGSYQNEFLVYRKTGEPCLKCGKKLVRIVVGGRGSWVCEKCQK